MATTGHHRKYAIHALNHPRPRGVRVRRSRRPKYDGWVMAALELVWRAANCICGKRLAPVLAATVAALRSQRVALWAKHGVMARSDLPVKRASDRIEYAEAGARYEYMNLVNGELGEGLSPEEIRAICAEFGVVQSVY